MWNHWWPITSVLKRHWKLMRWRDAVPASKSWYTCRPETLTILVNFKYNIIIYILKIKSKNNYIIIILIYIVNNKRNQNKLYIVYIGSNNTSGLREMKQQLIHAVYFIMYVTTAITYINYLFDLVNTTYATKYTNF